MAQLITVKLSRFDGSPWGFRLQGGKDFGTPLVVQKVNGGSLAEEAGLRAGDAVIRVNTSDMFNLRHKDAQDVIVRAGNNFEVTVQRGGGTWKPSVSPVTTSIPPPQPAAPVGNVIPVTKTSLAAKKQDAPLIGSGHNFSPKPFLNGTGEGPIKSIVNKQYNSPVGIYSEETIAETLSAQAEVLAGGVLGVNFKKNEKNYNAENSEVFKMVQEHDKEPRSPEPAEPTAQSNLVAPTTPTLAGLRPVSAPETKPPSSAPQTTLPPGQNICAECERLIVGVFVRIKEKNLHVECFKCSTCGTSLKNVGYYNINNKLYCDIHAKLVARQAAPAGLAPVTVPPGGKAPAGTISAALANVGGSLAPLSPLSSSSLTNHSSPLPFTACDRTSPDGSLRARGPRPTTNGNSSYHGRATVECNGKSENAKTFTSTLTIQTGNEVGSTNGSTELSTNNNDNPTNKARTVVDRYIGSNHAPKIGEVCELVFNPALTEQGPNVCRTTPASVKTYPLRNQAPTSNNIGGPKPFGGSSIAPPSLASPPIFNSGSNSTVPRPQSQTATESYLDESTYYEVIEARPEKPAVSVKEKSLVWPPPKPIEDITYPTASPLYINPNPVLDRRHQKLVRERRKSVEEVLKSNSRRGSDVSVTREALEEVARIMENASCSGPVYRRVEVRVEREVERETRPRQNISRPCSTEGVRRSLTPTRITQPVPRPWTATVTTGSNLYHSVCPPPPPPPPEPPVCHTFRQQQQQQVCQRQQVCQQQQQQQQQRCYQAEVQQRRVYQEQKCGQQQQQRYSCQRAVQEPTVCRRATQEVCAPVMQKPVVRFRSEEEEVGRTEREEESRDLSTVVPSSVAVCPKGVEGQHEFYTETTEDDEGPLHIKKTTTYEKTVELLSPDEEAPPDIAEERFEEREDRQITSSGCQGRSSTLDQEVEDISGRRSVAESAEVISSAVDAQQLVEKITREEKEEREEERLEERAVSQEKRVSFSEKREVVQENVKVDERSHESTSDERYHELTDEIQIQENFKQMELEEQRRKSLRAQVEVHQSLREQQAPERRCQSLQERRLSARFSQQSAPQPTQQQEFTEKHVQFVTQTESGGIKPLPPTTIKNATPKEWKSEMVRALTTAPARPYSPLNPSPYEEQSSSQECYSREVTTTKYEGRPGYSATCYSSTSSGKKEPKLPELSEPYYPSGEEPHRPISPFQEALTTAPDRPYTPLGESEDNAYPRCTCCASKTSECRCEEPQGTRYSSYESRETREDRRSQTPSIQATSDGYCAPAEILYTDTKTQETIRRERSLSRKSITPQPLPTPPPDYRFRDSSRSPARSRPETPSNRSLMTGLKKPGAIPAYQRNLVAMKKEPLDCQTYVPSRSPTPTPGRSKSPAQGPPEPPPCFIKAQAPKIRDDPPPKCREAPLASQIRKDPPRRCSEAPSAPTNGEDPPPKCEQPPLVPCPSLPRRSSEDEETILYHREKGGSTNRFIQDYAGKKTLSHMDDDEYRTRGAQLMRERQEELLANGEVVSHERGALQRVQKTIRDGEECEQSQQEQVEFAKPDQPESTSQRNSFRTCEPPQRVTVEYCKPDPPKQPSRPSSCCSISQSSRAQPSLCCPLSHDQSDRFPTTGVRVLPPIPKVVNAHTERSQVCQRSSGQICQSQGSAFRGTKNCTSPGLRSTSCGSNAGACSAEYGVTVTPLPDGSVCVAPCVSSVQCPKPILKNQCTVAAAKRATLPFPQIPLPYEPECQASTTLCPSSAQPEPNDLSFQPIHQPRTNLANQLTQLTLCQNKKQVVQVYKPQAQCSQSCPKKAQSCPDTAQSCPAFAPTSKTQNLVDPPNLSSHPDLGFGVGGHGSKSGSFAGSSAPKRGRGILNQAGGPGSRVPLCGHCNSYVRGPFITALGQIWCPDHFVCGNGQCRRPLQDIGFVEEKGQLYCEYCFEQFIAPNCDKCGKKIKGDCLNAIGKHFHPECFNCSYCGKLFGNSPFFLEEGLPYCESDWNELFTTKCFACGFPVEAGDRWVEALNNNYHSQCFNCTMCKKNLEGQSFYAKGGRPFCKNHAR